MATAIRILSGACIAAALTIGIVAHGATGASRIASSASATAETAGIDQLGFRWNDDLLAALGLTRTGGDLNVMRSAFTVRRRSGAFAGIDGGELALRGTLRFTRRDGADFEWRDPRGLVVPGSRPRIDFLDSDGVVLFRAESPMLEIPDGGLRLVLRSADLRIAPALAARLGRPRLAGLAVADLSFSAPFVSPLAPAAPGDPNWPGEPVPGVPGATYQADVFLVEMTASFTRCVGCDGPGGVDADPIFTPGATLANNRSNGSPVPVVAGDPRGTSSALYTADVPWYTKFAPAPNDPNFAYPYPGHDQHPYLIWNLYRLDANGSIRQVGKSAVKHAFLSGNEGASCDSSNGGHVLGRACADTYPEGSNDDNSALGPRAEIVPFTGQWGRCGSIWDADCDGVQSPFAPNTNLTNRMHVLESDIDIGVHPGATFLFEAWYVVRDDIDIRNTMGTLAAAISWDTGAWFVDVQPGYRLGPAIDRWIAPGTATASARSVELATPEGRATAAVRVANLGNGSWRYDYAVMNFDFARAQVSGVEANHTLRVLSSRGFGRFSVARGAGTIAQIAFADSDSQPSNDWNPTLTAGTVQWLAPATTASQDWGTLATFSFVSTAAPTSGTVELEPALAGSPASYSFELIVPGDVPLFASGFE